MLQAQQCLLPSLRAFLAPNINAIVPFITQRGAMPLTLIAQDCRLPICN